MKNYFILFTFYSTHLALEFERILQSKDIFVKLIPVPRKISSSCGLAGKIEENDLSKIKEICDEKDIEYEEIYKVYNDNKKSTEKI